MASASTDSTSTSTTKVNTAVTGVGDHDRVTMLSLNADGTPDQHAPEIIGDKVAAVAATQEQMAQQAVSAMEQRAMSETVAGEVATAAQSQDPAIEATIAEHRKVAAVAEKAAEKVVDSLHQG